MHLRFPNPFRHFRRNESGSVALEALLLMPIMTWAILATFDYFNIFNEISINTASTYTLADMISRQTETINPAYINGMGSLYDYLNGQTSTANAAASWVRVTCITYSTTSNSYSVVWSSANNNHTVLTTATMTPILSYLPTITNGDTLILVETQMTYKPPFNVGLKNLTLSQHVVTRPRLGPQVAYSPV